MTEITDAMVARGVDDINLFRSALAELANWVRDYAMAHDFQNYPAQLVYAEEVLDAFDDAKGAA